MFYAHFVLAKRGPLARVWLAAHWDKKLSKAQIFETDLDMSVEEIIRPKVKLALRTSGHLLLGVVRIYSRKTKYLLSDCSDAFLKIRLAFRPGLDSIDLEGGAQEAPLSAINLSEPIYDFDATVVDLADLNMQSMFTIHQGRPEDITMREDVSVNDLLRVDEFRFDDFINMADDVELFGHGTMQKSFTEKRSKSSKSPKSPSEDDAERERDREERTVLPMEQESSAIASGAAISDDFGGPMNEDPFADIDQHAAARLFEESLVTLPPLQDDRDPFEMERRGGEPAGGAPEQTTLISANDTAFLLAPVDATTISVSRRATRRKRKLVIDEVKSMSSTLMKQHMEETSDITAPLTLAPPTKKAMTLLADFDSLLARPGRPIHSKGLRKLFLDNLVTRPVTDDNDNRPMHAADETMEHIDNEARLTPISEHSEPGSRASGTAVDDLLILPELEMARDDSGANESALAGAPRDSMLSMGDISLASHGFDISAAEVPRHFDGDLNDSPPPPAVKIVPEVLDKNRRVTRRSARVDRSSEVPLTPARPDVPITPVPGEVQRTPLRLDVQMTPDVSQQQRLPFENTTPRRFGSHSYSSASLRDNGSDFEEVSQASRQQQLLGLLQPHLAKAKGTVTFKKIAEGRGCRLAASQFSALLTLAKTKVVTTVQDEHFGEIVIGRGSMYSAACQ